MSEAAAHPNVYCKISDLLSVDDNKPATGGGERGWKLETVKPYTDHVIKAFGTDRCMYGSNWPVCRVPRSPQGCDSTAFYPFRTIFRTHFRTLIRTPFRSIS